MAKTAEPEKVGAKYKRAFISGLATLLPTILTISVIWFCIDFVYNTIAARINGLIVLALETQPAREYYWTYLQNLPDWAFEEDAPEDWSPKAQKEFVPFSARVRAHVPAWLGLVLALLLVFLVGFLFRGYVGRQALHFLERVLQRIPLIKVIYPYAKQVTEFFFDSRKPIQYETAVAVEYPRTGIYCLGFVTSEGFRDVEEICQEPVVTVFIPSSPTPFTGYTIMIPRAQVRPLNLTIDEALRFTISGGVLLPPRQMPPIALKTRKLERPTSG